MLALMIQDAIVTIMALGAIGLVVRRVVGTFRPASAAPACTTCPSCPSPRAEPTPTPTPVAIANLRSHHAQAARPPRASGHR